MATNFDDLFDAAAKEFEAAFTRSGIGIRPDEKGGPREQQLRNFLGDWLPARFGITNGYVISREKKISRQCDIAFFNIDTCPKFLLDKDTDRRLIPFGDLFGIIEVKSTLGEKELNDSLEKIKSVDDLYSEVLIDHVQLPGNNYDEIDIQAAEVKREENFFDTLRHQDPYIHESAWDQFKVRIPKKHLRRTSPFSIIFAYKLSPDLTLEEMQRIFSQSQNVPNGVFILDSGFLLLLTSEGLQRYKSIKLGRPLVDLAWDIDVLFTVARKYTDSRSSHFLRESQLESRINLMYFYVFLLDMLKSQELIPYPHTDLISIWQK
jgi:hypothetical protein